MINLFLLNVLLLAGLIAKFTAGGSYGGPQGSLHKKGELHIKHCTLYKCKMLLQIKNVATNKKCCYK